MNADAGHDIRKAEKPAFKVELYSDASFDVRWSHAGYVYYRSADNVLMTSTAYSTAKAAETALVREQYPGKIA